MTDTSILFGTASVASPVLVTADQQTIVGDGSTERPLRGVGGGGAGPSPTATQTVYVNKGGNDTTGNGSFEKPFLTIQAGMNFITDADRPKRYALLLGPGDYVDPVVTKPWIWVVGDALNTTRITGPVTLGPGWNPSPPFNTDARGGFVNIVFTTGQTFDFRAVSSVEGKLFFDNCAFNAAPVLVAFSNVNQSTFNGCRFFAGLSQTGISNTIANCFFQNAGAIVLTSVNTGDNIPTQLQAFGGGTDGDFQATWTSTPPAANQIEIQLLAFAVQGHVTLDGASVAYSTGPEGFPKVANLTLLNGAPAPVEVTG